MDESTRGVEVWCSGEDWCPITSTATLIGKKWHTVIIHRLLENGPLGFNALEEEVDGISSKVLSDAGRPRGEAAREPRDRQRKAVRVEYSLTELGESLEPVIVEMRDWGANTSWQRLTRIVRSREPVVRTGSSRVTPPAGVPTGRPRSRRVGPPATRGKRGARRVPRALVDGVSRLLCGECLRAYADVCGSVSIHPGTNGSLVEAALGPSRTLTVSGVRLREQIVIERIHVLSGVRERYLRVDEVVFLELL